MLNERVTCTFWNNSMEVRSLRVFDNVLLLELSVIIIHRIIFTFSIFKWEKYSFYGKKPVWLKVRDPCIQWNYTVKVRRCSVLHITCP
jgi:hypothetical protein